MSSRYSTNYDRFAAVVDSDESDVDDKLAGAAASGSGEDSGVAAAMLRMLGGSSGATPGGAQPTRLAYCRLAPGHDARVLRPVFRTHPRDFVPVADPARGFCHTWGVWQDAPDGDKAAQEAASSEYMNHMMLGNLYIGLEFGRPEQQFVEYLRDRKLARLEAERAARAPLYTSSFVIRYALTRDKWRGLKELVPPVWRRLRVSGGTTLFSLWDKLLCPAMGWCRNYHASVWTDPSDGSQFGAPDSSSIDVMHVSTNGWVVADDKQVRLAELMSAPGDRLVHLYDLGDGWSGLVTLEEVLSESLPVAVLGGGGSCPPEDSNGLESMGPQAFQAVLTAATSAAPGEAARRRLAEARSGVAQAMNYSSARLFMAYPLGFDVALAAERVREALGTPVSVPSGAKVNITPMPGAGGAAEALAGMRAPPREGEALVSTPTGFSFLTETVGTKKDVQAVALCASCGVPSTPGLKLKTCGACLLVRYCSSACQLAHWRGGHKQACVPATATDAGA